MIRCRVYVEPQGWAPCRRGPARRNPGDGAEARQRSGVFACESREGAGHLRRCGEHQRRLAARDHPRLADGRPPGQQPLRLDGAAGLRGALRLHCSLRPWVVQRHRPVPGATRPGGRGQPQGRPVPGRREAIVPASGHKGPIDPFSHAADRATAVPELGSAGIAASGTPLPSTASLPRPERQVLDSQQRASVGYVMR